MKSNGGTRRPFKKRKNSVATEENRGQEREARCQDSSGTTNESGCGEGVAGSVELRMEPPGAGKCPGQRRRSMTQPCGTMLKP